HRDPSPDRHRSRRPLVGRCGAPGVGATPSGGGAREIRDRPPPPAGVQLTSRAKPEDKAMSELRVRPKGTRGLVAEVTPESAGWTYVGFALHRLGARESLAAETRSREVCLVLVSGKARLSIDGKDFGTIGERMSPFEGPPWAAYVPAHSRYA